MRTDTEIMQLIDEAIKSVWKNEIKSDYAHLKRCFGQGLILKGFACGLSGDGEPHIRKEIPIILEKSNAI